MTCDFWAENDESILRDTERAEISRPKRKICRMRIALVLLSSTLVFPFVAHSQAAQSERLGSSCTLKNYVYTCESAAFAPIFAAAKNATVETQNVDAFARQQLKKMLTAKYGKQVVEPEGAPELIFLIIPVGVDGINYNTGEPPLGSLRVYAATPAGGRDHLVWAETYSGRQDLPWPAVVNSLISQFQKHFPGK